MLTKLNNILQIQFQKDIDKTIQSGLKEIQHSYNVMEQSVENFILPKLENFSNAHDELSKKEIYSLAVFADSLNKTILQAENKKNEGSFARIYHYQNFDKKLLDDLKNSALIAYNLVKDEDKQRCKTAQEIERTR